MKTMFDVKIFLKSIDPNEIIKGYKQKSACVQKDLLENMMITFRKGAGADTEVIMITSLYFSNPALWNQTFTQKRQLLK